MDVSVKYCTSRGERTLPLASWRKKSSIVKSRDLTKPGLPSHIPYRPPACPSVYKPVYVINNVAELRRCRSRCHGIECNVCMHACVYRRGPAKRSDGIMIARVYRVLFARANRATTDTQVAWPGRLKHLPDCVDDEGGCCGRESEHYLELCVLGGASHTEIQRRGGRDGALDREGRLRLGGAELLGRGLRGLDWVGQLVGTFFFFLFFSFRFFFVLAKGDLVSGTYSLRTLCAALDVRWW